MRFGFDVPPDPEEGHAMAQPVDAATMATAMLEAFAKVVGDMPTPEIHLQLPGEAGKRTKKVIKRGENGEIIEVEEVAVEQS
jgi:hypothetical protein